MQKEIETLLIKDFLNSNSYRDFLSKFFKTKKKLNPYYSYSTFIKKAGFISRSYLSDIISGKKHIPAKSFSKFLKGLELPTCLKEGFRFLVMLEENDLNYEHITKEEIKLYLNKIYIRLKRLNAQSIDKLDASIYKLFTWPYIYAALGDEKNGANLKEISERAKIPTTKIRPILNELIKYKVVTYDSNIDRYFAKDMHIIFNNFDKEYFVKKFFLKTLEKSKQSAEKFFSSNEKLFFNSVVSIKSEKLPIFKEKLKNLLYNYIETIENSNGDVVASLTVSLF